MTSPFLTNPNKLTTKKIMGFVVILLLPTIITMTLFFGIGIITNIVLSVIFCVLTEFFYLLFIEKLARAKRESLDGSVVVSAILFSLCLPPSVPFWILLFASFFIVLVAKQLYGGLGSNIFNPAMVGYVFVLISFPVQVTIWPTPHLESNFLISLLNGVSYFFSDNANYLSVDSLSNATPLNLINHNINEVKNITLNQSVWFLINLVSLIAGVILLRMKIISWHLPLSFLATFFVINLFYLAILDLSFNFIWLQFFSGATMLGAFFVLTDPVSAATTPNGKIAQGICFAIFLFSIRSLSITYPDGIAFAIILCNLINPLLDKILKPRRYGF